MNAVRVDLHVLQKLILEDVVDVGSGKERLLGTLRRVGRDLIPKVDHVSQ